MRVLVTGATGLVGSAIVNQLLNSGYKVKIFARETSDYYLLEGLKIEKVEGDLLDISSIEKALEDIDYVVHAAGYISFRKKDAAQMYKVNVEGTSNLVNCCLKANVKKFIHISSVAAVGRPEKIGDRIELDEEEKWVSSPNNSNYAKSKHLAEKEVWRAQAEGLDVGIINPSIVLGEGSWDKSSTQLFKYVYNENPFYPPGYLNYVDVKDIAKVVVQLMESDIVNERFILNAGTISYKEFFDKIGKAFEKKSPNIQLNILFMEIFWRFEVVRSWLLGSAPLITKETTNTAKSHIHFLNNKAKQILGINFTPIDESIDRITAYLKKENYFKR